MTFPKHIQQAVDLGLLQAEGDKITGVGSEEAETILGISRLMEKIQPTIKAEEDETKDQEAIVLCRGHCGNAEIEYEESHDDGEDTVGQGLQPQWRYFRRLVLRGSHCVCLSGHAPQA